MRRSLTEDTINAQISEATEMTERRRLQIMLWMKGKQSKEEKDESQMTHILRNLHAGGWGKKNMTQKMKGMTHYRFDDGTETTNTAEISVQATKYYKELFLPEAAAPTDAEREKNLGGYFDDEFRSGGPPRSAYDTRPHEGRHPRLPSTPDVRVRRRRGRSVADRRSRMPRGADDARVGHQQDGDGLRATANSKRAAGRRSTCRAFRGRGTCNERHYACTRAMRVQIQCMCSCSQS